MALSEEQKRIVLHSVEKHANVLAVAGSGKSTTMIERIAYLVEAHRVKHQQIIAVMFNTGASAEFGEKVAKRLGSRNAPDSVTFHGLGTYTLRWLVKGEFLPAWEFVGNVQRARKFAASVIEPFCKRLGYRYPMMIADVFMTFIDRVKSDLETPEAVWGLGSWDAQYQWFVEAYKQYERAREKAGVRFFSDLIYDPVVAMEKNPEAAEYVANRYQHMIVDEYQDICESQQALVRFVAGRRARVMSVGDDDQCIYTWRGAKPSYILVGFYRDFPGAITYKLTRTFRYGHILSCAANYVITHNVNRAAKLCISAHSTPNTQIKIEWEDTQASNLLKLIEDQIAAGRPLSDIAVLFRTYARTGSSQFALLRAGIPFRLEGGEKHSVLENSSVKGLLSWMQLASGQLASKPYQGDPDFGSISTIREMLNIPSLGLTWDMANELARCVLVQPDGIEGFTTFVAGNLTGMVSHLSEAVIRRGRLWRAVRALAKEKTKPEPANLVRELMRELALVDSLQKLAKSVEDFEDRMAVIDAFVAYIDTWQEGAGLAKFIGHMADLRSFSDKAKSSTIAILFTSIHRSKGLEWPCVFMIGLAEGHFPHKPRKAAVNEAGEAARVEDERRLFYVGMTRARQLLTFLCPFDDNLMPWLQAGKTGSPEYLSEKGDRASRFLYESNLVLSRALPSIANKKIAPTPADPDQMNFYLEAIGSDVRLISAKVAQQS
ncbi:ATP-dependent helicase [Pseudomonas sp. NPDC096950]|uniref:ATP-dependent helicase n=1 Tax=Pseudomonas sp. NPDC096950 TaxID=3364485 RepID=UPI003839EBC1